MTSGAHVEKEAGEFDADGAGADDQEFFRHGRRHHRVFVGPDERAVGFQARKLAGAGAGGEDDVLGLQSDGLFAAHRDAAGASEAAVAIEYRNLVPLQQEADAGGELLGDGARAFDDLGEVEADIVRGEAEFVEMVQQVG